MFNLSGSEIVAILLLALVVLGPDKLPDAMRRAGRFYAQVKKMGDTFQTEMRNALDEPMKEMRDTADLLRDAADFTGPSEPPGGSAAPTAAADDRDARIRRALSGGDGGASAAGTSPARDEVDAPPGEATTA